MEGGQIKRSSIGTQQGSVVAPILSNIYLHYVLDLWFAEDAVPRMEGRCSLTRFADDFVIVFERAYDCQRVYQVLEKRFAKYGLALHPEKTRVIDFRPHIAKQQQKKTAIFDFLGFTHLWGKSREGKTVVHRRTAKSRLSRTVKAITTYCKKSRHTGLEEQHRKLKQMLTGHYAYYGITGNYRSINRVRHRASRAWQKWLSRRSWKSRIVWEAFEKLLEKYPLPKARIYHGYT
jgi:RNA-directed DNA polymerase